MILGIFRDYGFCVEDILRFYGFVWVDSIDFK